jgi:hypothetical protein
MARSKGNTEYNLASLSFAGITRFRFRGSLKADVRSKISDHRLKPSSGICAPGSEFRQ